MFVLNINAKLKLCLALFYSIFYFVWVDELVRELMLQLEFSAIIAKLSYLCLVINFIKGFSYAIVAGKELKEKANLSAFLTAYS